MRFGTWNVWTLLRAGSVNQRHEALVSVNQRHDFADGNRKNLLHVWIVTCVMSIKQSAPINLYHHDHPPANVASWKMN